MVKFNRRNISISALWVSKNDKQSDFYASSWQRGDSVVQMLVIRLLLTASALAIFTWSLVEGARPYWLIYLTNWGILLVTATTLSGLIVSFTFLCKKPLETTRLPWCVSCYWLLFNTTVTISIMITALYWILLYNPATHEQLGLRAFWLDIATHGLTSCIIVVELLISRTPVRLAHIYHPLLIGLCYIAFSGIYFAAGGTDSNGNPFIYAVLNWQEPHSAGIVVAGSVAALVVLYLILWGLAYFRDKFSRSLMRTKSINLAPTPPLHRQMV